MAHFDIEHLTFSYPGSSVRVLDDVCLSAERGSYVTICGKSGCGKTTLLRHLKSVLTPHGERSGEVRFDGMLLDEVSQRDQSAQIGFVMQNPDSQVVTDKVWHELAFGLESLGCDQRTMRLRVAEMASYFGIQGWFHKDVRDLSGGQKQLLNLASIMAMQPSVLILDEPTSQLDPIAAADFLNTVRKINLELGTTVILTEHRLEEVFTAADRVVVMEAGRIIADADPVSVGEQLRASGNDMVAALPAPMRIFYGVTSPAGVGMTREAAPGDVISHGISSGGVSTSERCPLNVREGRAWLTRAYGDARQKPMIQTTGAKLTDETQGMSQAPGAKLNREERAIEIKDVWFRYARDLPDVICDLNIEIAIGTMHAIVGGNGTGKSTMLKIACGAENPYRGTVRLLGKKTKDFKNGEQFRGTIAMLPQDPANLLVKKTVREDLSEMLQFIPGGGEDAIMEAAQTTGVTHLLDEHPYDLSGGEQQRAALAKVLMTHPKILLLDEPTKGIDSFFKARLANVFSELKTNGMTIVMVSHDIEFCASHADVVSMFFDGSIVTTNTPRGFFSANSFYTTAANRMSRHLFPQAITDEDVIKSCKSITR